MDYDPMDCPSGVIRLLGDLRRAAQRLQEDIALQRLDPTAAREFAVTCADAARGVLCLAEQQEPGPVDEALAQAARAAVPSVLDGAAIREAIGPHH